MTIPEVRLIEHDGVHYAAAVMLVPRGEEVRRREGGPPLSLLYTISGPGWTHWGYTTSYSRAWDNVRRVTKRHRARMERKNAVA